MAGPRCTRPAGSPGTCLSMPGRCRTGRRRQVDNECCRPRAMRPRTEISISDSSVVRLSRAIAIRHRHGSEAALAVPIADRLESYHPYHATRALMLRDLGRDSEAARENQRASSLTTNPAELQLLRRRAGGASGETPRLEIY